MNWILKDKTGLADFQSKIRLNPVTAQLLADRNMKNPQEIERFFDGRYEDLASPLEISGIEEVIGRIERAKKNGENISIFGDYDADGLTSSTLLKEALEEMGFLPSVYIPDRNKEGYGLNKNAIDFLAENYKTDLIITVDCGISNREEIAYAREKGIDVIVTDHHAIPKKLPTDCILVNPKLPGQKYQFPDLAGVGVAFKLVQALFEKFLPEKIDQLKWYLDLVAIGTIADCVPLIDENRILAKFGLIVLQKTRRTGILEIIQTGRLTFGEKNPPTVENVAFQIAPRLNASGRVDHADLTLNLLIEKDPAKARVLALEVEAKNTERQKVSQQIYAEVKKTLDSEKDYRLIIRSSKHWPLGLVGVVAGKICEEFHCPVFLLREGDELLEGSGRSIDVFNIFKAVSRLEKYLEKFGGHSQAMGIKIRPENLGPFEKGLAEIIDSAYNSEKWGKKILIDLEVGSENIDWDLLAEIRRFEPFGEGNREPIFLTRDFIVRGVKVVGNGQKHLKLALEGEKSKFFEGIFWRAGERSGEISVGDEISTVYHLKSNEWNGNRKLELNIIDFQKNGKDKSLH
ncbi:MAG: single-stranded-DNA-specific exonuclease RecJ [Candidatus Moranbacteria bacterium]|nr:single-stranded-DNA-specific exonuclease RecJ [Candidatus Moranbacteria bacterium]